MTRERDTGVSPHMALEQLCSRVREHEEPSAADRAFVREQLAARLAAVGAGAAALAGASKAAASGSVAPALGASGTVAASAGGALKLGSLGVGAWLAGGAAVTAATVLLTHSLAYGPESSPSLASAPVQLAPSAQASPARARPVAPKTVTPERTVNEAAERPAPAEHAAVRVTARPAAASSSAASLRKPSLADEAQGLARVQRALRDGDTSAALALLDEQDRRFRGGSLAAERTAARALATCGSGRRGQLLAERFVIDHAGSPLAERVQRKCLNRP